MPQSKPKRINRFDAFNPEERYVLQTLLESHLNAVSEIAAIYDGAVRVGGYLAALEQLEAEVKEPRR